MVVDLLRCPRGRVPVLQIQNVMNMFTSNLKRAKSRLVITFISSLIAKTSSGHPRIVEKACCDC